MLLHDVEVENASHSVPFVAVQRSTIEVLEESDSPVPKSPTVSEPTPGPEFWALVDERRKATRRWPPQLITANVSPGGCAPIVDASETGFLLEHIFQVRDGQVVLLFTDNHMCRALVRAAVRHTKVHVSGDTGIVYRSGVEFLGAVDGLFDHLRLDVTCFSG